MFGKKIFCLYNGLQRNWIQALIAIFDIEILKYFHNIRQLTK